MNVETVELIEQREYGEAEETLDVLVRVQTLLHVLLDRRHPRWIERDLRQALASVSHQIGFTEEWVH